MFGRITTILYPGMMNVFACHCGILKKKTHYIVPCQRRMKGQLLDNFCTTDKKYAFRRENEQILKLSLLNSFSKVNVLKDKKD